MAAAGRGGRRRAQPPEAVCGTPGRREAGRALALAPFPQTDRPALTFSPPGSRGQRTRAAAGPEEEAAPGAAGPGGVPRHAPVGSYR